MTLLNEYGPGYDQEQESDFVRTLLERHQPGELLDFMDEWRDVSALVIGDIIIDEYTFCTPLGMSEKSGVIVAREHETVAHAGGVLAVANHLAGLCRRVTVVGSIGQEPSWRSFVDRELRPNVVRRLLQRDGYTTTTKRRYIQETNARKMFEIAQLDDGPMSAAEVNSLNAIIEAEASQHDIIVITDFGHGLIDGSTIDLVCALEAFLAVNVQANSANLGFNVATKYPRANYVSLDEREARLALHDRYGSLGQVMDELAGRLDLDLLSVTLGFRGCAVKATGARTVYAPVMSPKVVDTIGAGDAFLSISSLAAMSGLPAEVVAFFGTLGGAHAVTYLGNAEFLSSEALQAAMKQKVDAVREDRS